MPGCTSNMGDMGIFDEVFPDGVSVSDLCDCGKPNCVYGKKKTTSNPTGPVHKGPFPKSDYQSTFEAVKHPRPRSSKRPPASARDPRPLPMFLSTNQKDSFKNLGQVERVRPIIQEDQHEASTAPLDGMTFYAQEFTKKQVHTEPAQRQASRRDLIHREPATFDGTTTNMQHYKRWVPQPSLTFGELPSFTGSLMYPKAGQTDPTMSTMKSNYVGTWQDPVSLIKNNASTIKLEGNHSFSTTNDATYTMIQGDHRCPQLKQKDTTPLKKRGQFEGQTQSMADFPGYRKGQPKPPKMIEPAPMTIDLKFNNKQQFSTEQRSIYRGHNVVNNPVPVSCKAGVEEYSRPDVKFETETSQKRDYQPVTINASDYSKVKVPQATMGVPVDAKFEGRTMNKEFFQDWGIQPRVRYGDFHENRPYIPSQEPFTTQSVTQSTYGLKKAEPIKFYKPADRPLDKGETDFNTVYQAEFQKKQQRMCRAQVFLIQQELRRKKNHSAPHAHKTQVA